LEGQIDSIQPKVIVLLGKVAAQTLLGTDYTLGRMRGQWYHVRGVETRVTYHPAALLRNASFKRPTWEDMQIIRDRLSEQS
ncbi:MAG: uracil-DNA glycosylase family protein, partial [Thermoanaerobaculia bacterium]